MNSFLKSISSSPCLPLQCPRSSKKKYSLRSQFLVHFLHLGFLGCCWMLQFGCMVSDHFLFRTPALKSQNQGSEVICLLHPKYLYSPFDSDSLLWKEKLKICRIYSPFSFRKRAWFFFPSDFHSDHFWKGTGIMAELPNEVLLLLAGCWPEMPEADSRKMAIFLENQEHKCMNRVKHQKRHPGKELFQQNLFALFFPSSLTHVWVCQPPTFYFNCERFRPFIFNYPILQWISEAPKHGLVIPKNVFNLLSWLVSCCLLQQKMERIPLSWRHKHST